MRKHEKWRVENCINLIPSENVTSLHVQALLSSDLGHRYTSRSGFYAGTCYIDEIEALGEKIAAEVFHAECADLRPTSGHLADLIFLASFTSPGDKIMCVGPEDGGYPGISSEGAPNFLGLKVIYLPFSRKSMNIQTNEAVDFIHQKQPKVVLLGASLFLFPHPIRKIAEATADVGAILGYDGSHVLGLIAGGEFQDPLKEGAQIVTGSTHKSFFGPQGGIILANSEYEEVIRKTVHPAFVDNAHWNRIAALTMALIEMKHFGREYAHQVVKNAKALAKALYEHGLPALCRNYDYTSSHQIFLDYGWKKGKLIAEKLEKANVIVDCGVRIGTCEVTRRGMKEKEMELIAELIARVLVSNEAPARVKLDAIKLRKHFPKLSYCFES
jgi:glycine hydroxymethyltransferase